MPLAPHNTGPEKIEPFRIPGWEPFTGTAGWRFGVYVRFGTFGVSSALLSIVVAALRWIKPLEHCLRRLALRLDPFITGGVESNLY